ncbi:30S ribosomal protein S12 methylthiotransferase RimO [Nitrosophilus kaiyonis]|uniref:30S ribosomal protein S12 methylthiotransferase RimO n=1 Tax=Nitrosophilus kaiyonis TaxID=2930200 RepID=UPI002492984B|nr:30S ribosomal protein S12 methylthiotransferase RimO [Nitrosophilus kaiyonis]
MKKKLFVVSLGCTKNLVDTEVMLAKLKDYEVCSNVKDSDVIIVNTCGFINAAKEESLQTIFELHNQRKKDSILVMAGCLSERYKEELQKELKEVDIFTGVGDYSKIDKLIKEKKNSFSQKPYLIKDEERIITGSNFHAYIKLSEGCNQTCSFCAIPSFKGKLQSREIVQIYNEIKRLKEKGFNDFTFVSQDSSSYLRDFKIQNGLIKLVEKVEEIEDINARILYLYPSTTTPELIEKIANSKTVYNYFEMPIQHISDKMLKIMKRGAGKKRTLDLLEKMRKVENSFLRTSIIVGHPGETDEDFNELCKFLEEFDFDRINVFAYSDEEGTKAYEMKEKIPKDIIEERLSIIQEIIDKKVEKSLKKDLNREIEVILEGTSGESELLLSARKTNWAPEVDGEILINESEIKDLKVGNRYKVLINDIVDNKLIGKIIANG